MTDYVPSIWQSTKLKAGYTYYMLKSESATRDSLKDIKHRIKDIKIYMRPYPVGTRHYHGWVKLEGELELYDAMEAGLVPVKRGQVS